MFNPIFWFLKFIQWYFRLPSRKQFAVSLFVLGFILLIIGVVGLWLSIILNPYR